MVSLKTHVMLQRTRFMLILHIPPPIIKSCRVLCEHRDQISPFSEAPPAAVSSGDDAVVGAASAAAAAAAATTFCC